MTQMTQPPLPLRSGTSIPVLGLGTWQLRGERGYDAVRAALDIGYRHIDTATAYENEEVIGRAVRDSGVPREEVFLTTKFPPELVGHERETIDASLRLLGMEYVDLWLVHWPPGGRAAPDTWRELVAAQQRGQARAIGVSNYSVGQIDELIRATDAAPEINQIPWSPRDFDAEVVDAHTGRGIVLEGYSAFKRSNLEDLVLVDIAAAHGVSPAQVVLRWHVEHDIVVIPKSANADRLAANYAIWGWSLTPEEVAAVDALAS